MLGEVPVTISGHLVNDPQLSRDNGLVVANFRVASTTRVYDRKSDRMVDGKAVYLSCSAYREMAEHVAASLRKGMRVIATGQLSHRDYETRDGERRSSYSLDVDDVGPSLRWADVVVHDRPRQQRSA